MAYTTINDPSKYFQSTIYTGTGSTRNVTNVGNSDLKPDWVWIKARNQGDQEHNVYDTVRGTSKRIQPNSTEAQSDRDGVTAFLTDGFTTSYSDANTNTHLYVAWQWRAGQGTNQTNNAGANSADLASTFSVDTTAGFSIVNFTTDGDDQTIYHGIGKKPDAIIMKPLTTANWIVQPTVDGTVANRYLLLHANDQMGTDGSYSEPTTTLFSTSNNIAPDAEHIAYVWAGIKGFSRMGSYKGNGGDNGPFVHLGFKPAWLMIKCATGHTESWHVWDNVRDTSNPNQNALTPDTIAQETGDSTPYNIDFLANGFKIREDHDITNGSGDTYFYMAFAHRPFVSEVTDGDTFYVPTCGYFSK